MIFLSVGEKSGDLLGASLLKALYHAHPSATVAAVAGPLMREHPLLLIEEMESFQVMGIVDILTHLPSLITLFYKVRKAILQLSPDTLIFIDYPEYHMLLAKSLRKSGYQGKIVQVVCPSVWAWRKNRMKTLETYFDHLFCLFPFEPALFSSKNLQVSYVGHPLADQIPASLGEKEPLLSLFPGSRQGEIKRNLPLQLAVAKKFVLAHPEFQIAISTANDAVRAECLARGVDALFFPPTENQTMMKKSSFALAKSGTVNLELALHKVPTVVTYVMNWLDYILAKYVLRIKLPHLCIVNILLDRRLFPEHYGHNLSIEAVYQDLETLSPINDELRSLFGNKKSAEEIVAILFSSSL
jgi:lipid-A-disaccharide synthase